MAIKTDGPPLWKSSVSWSLALHMQKKLFVGKWPLFLEPLTFGSWFAYQIYALDKTIWKIYLLLSSVQAFTFKRQIWFFLLRRSQNAGACTELFERYLIGILFSRALIWYANQLPKINGSKNICHFPTKSCQKKTLFAEILVGVHVVAQLLAFLVALW